MRSRTSDWFEVKVRYEKTVEDGTQKRVTEKYVVDALSFTEGETTITDEMAVYISGDYKVTAMAPTSYHEIFFSDDDTDDKWYKAKLQFITIDEKTENEKRSTVIYLVQGSSLPKALKHIEEVMSGTMIDYVIVGINETQIMDVFEHKGSAKKSGEVEGKTETKPDEVTVDEDDMEMVDLPVGSDIYDKLIAEHRHVAKPYDILLPNGEKVRIPVGTPLTTEGTSAVLLHGKGTVLYVIKKDKEDKYIKKG